MKVVIPAAGRGTRMFPASKSIPKEMLVVTDKPVIDYVVGECIASGFKEIVFVLGPGKESIKDYFENNDMYKGIKFEYIYQKEPLGLGHAVLCAYPYIGNKPFAVALPDVLLKPSNRSFKSMKESFYQDHLSKVMVKDVPWDQISSYGIIDVENKNYFSPGSISKIVNMVEKPLNGEINSNFSAIGRYIFTGNIWNLLCNVNPDSSGEIQLTTAISELYNSCAYYMIGKSYDCGSKVGYINTFIEFSLLNENYKHSIEISS
ncbi:UTP--glucose-1-phosphate uridylyltransferase [Vibrio lentus]|uniref:UTP--glucose-1-phosphate uridylyltransferase n=1 Tax=Vibrio lentus TaxID=136468 RepID=UPI000C815212|nr:sugar phosphate nucleotidyltransferase [Vibrio lentus]PMI79091.1 hypothetical protein BCU36_20440 [Vibrio lentus]